MSISERGDLDRTTTTTTNRILEQFKSELDKAGWMNILYIVGIGIWGK